ncbi:MAG: DNA polymerase I [Deltaproteobacteria bacterium ADurb.Bin510]|nr:MAG: DNA polymerase I [Deltaproteobacteria bacterium ADurb.Bin510]
MLLKLLKDERPEYICFVRDSKALTHHHERYAAYKANRQRMPEDLQIQVPYIHEVVAALGIPMVEREGLEADDLIAGLAGTYGGAHEVVIVSGDKDLMQLVGAGVTVWDTLKDQRFDAAAVQEKYGVAPEYIADLLALMGDSSDNVPGVPGIGAKGALKLVGEWGHVENILAHADELSPPKARQALSDHAELARLSLELVRLDTGLDAGLSLEELAIKPQNKTRLAELFSELEFKGLLKDLGEEVPAAAPAAVSFEFGLPDDLSGPAGFYRVAGLGSALALDGACYVELEPAGLFDADRSLAPLDNPALSLSIHDVKALGVECIAARVFDSLLAAYCLDAEAGAQSLEQLAASHLNTELASLKDLTGTGRGQRTLAELGRQEVAAFLAAHAEALLRLRPVLETRLAQAGVAELYAGLELPLMGVLGSMERAGILLAPAVLKEMASEIDAQLVELETAIYALAGSEFNINSPQQLGKVLFEDLGLGTIKKTKTGFSTDSKVLSALAAEHELPARILEYRGLMKLKNTYVDTLPALADKQGRIHGRFNQAVTATGRISSSEPNLQNIPIRTELGRRIRAAFVAPPGYVLLSADYSQIELRILAHVSQDRALLEAFADEADIHTLTASEVFGLAPEEVSAAQRARAKTINFGIIYGMGPHKLSGELGISQKVAKTYIDNYLAKYPGVHAYIERVVEEARHTGYVTTLLGRRRSIAAINSRNFNEREAARRIAVNTPIQGSAADIIKLAMLRIQERLAGLKSRLILQVHDELVLEVCEQKLEQLKVELGWGPDWGAAH